jgi:broad specificity phosphatase PhoE
MNSVMVGRKMMFSSLKSAKEMVGGPLELADADVSEREHFAATTTTTTTVQETHTARTEWQHMKLLLIRHAETVDNVTGVYAGVRNSVLTNFGVDQANKLGDHLARSGNTITHIFTSPLIRTTKTAEAIRKAQATVNPGAASFTLEIVKVPELIEQVRNVTTANAIPTNWYQDFGYYEGKTFQARSADSKKNGRESHREKHKDDAGFVDVESRESMAKRADLFLDQHLLPLLAPDLPTKEYTVAVVSHGILLSNLWRRLLLRLPRKSLTISPKVRPARGDIVLEHLGGWSNTGYLHLSIERDSLLVNDHDGPAPQSEPSNTGLKAPTSRLPFIRDAAVSPISESRASGVEPHPAFSANVPRKLDGYSTRILAINNKQHLAGLKRQRGGIGRSAHDESQKKLDGFSKKQRKD